MHAYIYIHACMLGRFSCVQLLVTLWSVACEAPVSMGFSRQVYWSGSPCPPPGDLLNSAQIHISYISCSDRQFFTTSTTCEAHINMYIFMYFICTETIHFWRFILELVTVIVSRERIHTDGRQEQEEYLTSHYTHLYISCILYCVLPIQKIKVN